MATKTAEEKCSETKETEKELANKQKEYDDLMKLYSE
jgi:hypothetical protein